MLKLVLPFNMVSKQLTTPPLHWGLNIPRHSPINVFIYMIDIHQTHTISSVTILQYYIYVDSPMWSVPVLRRFTALQVELCTSSSTPFACSLSLPCHRTHLVRHFIFPYAIAILILISKRIISTSPNIM